MFQNFFFKAGKIGMIFLVSFFSFQQASAQFSFSDNATNYAGSWTNGSNQGTGFNGWGITTGGANAGTFIGDPAGNGMSNTNIGNTSFALFGHSGQYVNTSRYFGAAGTNVPMQIGDVFSFYWAMNWDCGSSGSKGFDFRTDGTTIFNVNNSNSATISTSNGATASGYGTVPMLVTLTRTSWTQYSFTMTARDGNSANNYSTTINSSSNINNINLYCGSQQDNNGNRNIYFNAFNYTKAAPYETNFDLTDTRVMAGSNGITKTGTNILTLNGTNTYTGATIVTAGTVQLGAANVIADASNVTLNGGTLRTGSGAGFSETVGTLTVSANSNLNFGTGAHTLTFANSGANIWTGFILISGWTGLFNGTAGTAGRLFVGNSAAGLTLEQATRVLFLNGTNYHTATILSTGEVVPTALVAMFWNGTTVASWTAANAWSLNPTGPYNQTWVSGRTAYFNLSSNTITGSTTNCSGIVAFENVTNTATGTLGTGAAGGGNCPILVTSGKTLNLNGQAISTTAGSSLTKNGLGILNMGAQGNSIPGGFVINQGIVAVGGNNGMGTGVLTINGGKIVNNSSTTRNPANTSIVVNGDFGLGDITNFAAGTGNLTFSGTVALGTSVTRTITLGAAATYALNGAISGTSSNLVLAATAAGTLSLGGVNTYGGNTTINGGTVLLTTGVNRLPTTTNLILNNASGVILNLNGQSQTVASISGGGAAGGNITLGTAILTVNQATNTGYSGIISGGGGFSKGGAGTLTLNGANGYTGLTTITAGTLQLGASGVIADGSNISLAGGTFRTGATAGFSETVGTLAMTANSTLALGTGSHTLTFANSSAVSWTAAATLTITGWTGGYDGTAGTAGRIFVGNSASGLSALQLSQIAFNNGTSLYSAVLLSTGELVASPNILIHWTEATTLTPWYTATNWTPNTASGAWSTSNIAVFNNTGSATAAGIDMSVSSLSLGAIQVSSQRIRALSIGNSSATATNGIITLSGATLSGIANSILCNNSGQLLTINNFQGGSSASTTRITLGNASDNVVSITGAGGITINGIIQGAGRNLTKSGTGAGALTLSGANTFGGNTAINGGSIICGLQNTLPSTTTVNLANTTGALLSLGTFSQNIASLSGGGTSGGNVSLGTATLSLIGAATNTFSGAFSATAGNLTLNNSSAVLILANAANAHTGSTTVTAGNLRLNPVSNATFASPLVLNGGTISTTGITATRTWTSSSTLNLNAASIMNLDAAVHTITFAASNLVTWNGATLTINGWTGTAGASGTGGKIFFGNSSAGLTAAQRAKIIFNGFTGTPVLLATGELVPAPLPVSYTWNGGTDNSWNTATNWTPNGVPTESDHVTLGGGTNLLTLASAVSVTNLTIAGNFSFTATGSLSVLGDISYTSGNPTFDCASTLSILSSASQTIPALSYGNLNISGGTRILASAGTINVCGTFTPSTSQTVTGSTLTLSGAVANTLPTSTYNNLNIQGGASGTVSLAAGATIAINGNLNITNNTTLDLSATATGGTVNLAGNLTLTNGIIRRTSTSTTSVFNFMKSSGIQTIAQSGGSVDLSGIAMNVGTGTSSNTVQLASDFVITATSFSSPYGFLRVQANASLDFQTWVLSGTGGFTTSANSTLITSNTNPGGAFNAHPATSGSLQNGSAAAQRVFATTANYIFTGSSDQFIGNGLTTVKSLIIKTTGGAKVTLNLASGSTTLTVTDTIKLQSGILFLNSGILAYNNYLLPIQGGPFNTGTMIATNNGSVFPQRTPGNFRIMLPTTASTTHNVNFTFPLGDIAGTAEYSPVTINFSYTRNATAMASAYFGLKCIDGRNPYDASLDNYLTRYWVVVGGGSLFNTSTVSSCNLSFAGTYQPGDVVGREASIKMNRSNVNTLQNTEDITSYTDTVNHILYSAALNDPSMFNDHDFFGRKTVPVYYRTSSSGKWQNVSNWLISSDPTFTSPAGVVPPIPPNSANCDSITILSSHIITADTLFPPYSMDQVLIAGTLNVDSGATMYFVNGPASLDVSVTGTLKVAGTPGQYPGSALKFGSSALYHHATRAAVSGTGVISSSSIPTATWIAGSECRVTGIRDYSLTPASLNQAFSDFTWDCPRQAFHYNAQGNLSNVTGNLNIGSTNGRLFSLTRTQPLAMNVGQNFNITGGNVLLSTGVLTGAASLAVAGNMNISSGSLSLTDSAATTTAISASVTGALSVSGSGSLILAGSSGSGAGSLTFNVTGATTVSSSSASALVFSAGSKATTFNANGGLTQSAGTINLVSSTANGTLNIPDNQSLSLNGGTLLAGSGGPGSVGTINVGTNSTSATTTSLNLGGGTLRLAASSSGILNLYGDMNLNAGSLERTAGTATVNFFATGSNFGSPKTQTLSQTSGTVSGTIAFNAGASNSFTRLVLGSNVNLGSGSSITVFGSGATNFAYFDFGSFVLSGLNFTQQNFATLATANPDGFWTIAGGPTTGSLQTTNTRSLSAAGNFSYNGNTAQVTGNALSNCLSLSVMNAAGLTLSTNLDVSGMVYLDYFGQHGKLKLAGFNLTMGAGASFSGQSAVDYVVTNGTGYLSMPVSTSAVQFPVGNSTYNPITLTPGAGSGIAYRVRVIDDVTTPAPNDGSMLINRYWNITAPTATANTILISAQWNTGDENAGYAGGSQVKVGCFGTIWTEANSTQSGANPFTASGSFAISTANLNSGIFFGVGKDGGFINSIVTYTWNGSVNTSWTDPGNWTPGTSTAGPLSTDNAIINVPGTNLLTITGSRSITDFTVSGTGTFTIASGGSLNVTGNISSSSSAVPSMDCNSSFLISSAASQTIPAFNFGNLDASGGDRVLAPSGTIGICGTFTPGAGAYTISGSTVNFNGTGAQTINSFNFHNLSISGSRGTNSVTLPSSTVGIAGAFTPTATFSSGGYVTTGNTIDFNATGAQTVAAFNYNNLTVSGARASNNVTLAGSGTIGVAGTFNPSATFTTGSYVNTGSTIDFNSAASQTIPAFGFYNNLSNSNNGPRTLANGTIKISGTYSPTSGAITIGTSTIDFAGAAGQVIPASFYYNITNSSNTDRTLASSGIIDINAGFTPTSGITTITGSTVRYSATTTGWNLTTFTTNVAARQYNNLTFAGTGGSWSLNGNTIGITGDLSVTAGTLLIGTSGGAATMNVDGNLLVNGGTLNTTNTTTAGTVNLLGNFSVSSGTFTKSGSGTGTVNFVKATGTQTFSSSGTISNANNWNFGNGTTANTVQLTSNVSGSTGVFNVNSGSTIDFGTNILTVTSGSFVLNSGASLVTANPNGISTGQNNTGSVNRTGGVAANINYNTGANYTYNGASAQITGAGFTGANNLSINNVSNVTLSAAATVSGILQFSNGYLDLGSNNLTIAATGSISGAGAGKYVRTAGTGLLRRTVDNSNTAVLFAVGRSSYNPISLANAPAGTSDVYGVNVADAISPSLNSSTKVVNRSWSVSEAVAGGSNLQVVAQWNSPSEEAAGFAAGSTNRIGLHNGSSWSQVNATQGGSNPFTFTSDANFTPASLTTAQVFAIGKDDAFICPAPPAISSLSITSGYSGDVITLTGTNLTGLTGATIGGTTATLGTQSGTSASITVLGGTTGTITVSSSPVCSGTSSQTFTYNGYISATTGSWNSGSTWRGGSVPVSLTPVTIDNGHNVTVNAIVNPSSLLINAGGTITGNDDAQQLRVNSGSGTITNNGTITLTSALVTTTPAWLVCNNLNMGSGAVFNNSCGNAGAVFVQSGFTLAANATYNHDAIGSSTAGVIADFPGLTGGANISINSSANVNITKWGVGGQNPPSLPTVVGGQWGNLSINIIGQTYSGSWQNSGGIANATSLSIAGTGTRDFRLTTANSNYTGNFGSINVSGGILSLCSGGSTGTGTIVLNVSGATTISGGAMSVHGSAASSAANTGTVTANFNGNVSITGGALYGLASNSSTSTYSSGTTTLNFNGDLGVGPGTFDMAYLPGYVAPSTATGAVNVNLKGNLSLASGGTIGSLNSINTGRATASTINFNKTSGTQTFSDAGTVSNHVISWLVNGGSNTVQLLSSADLGTDATGSFTVNSGSTLDCGANVLSGGGAFTAQSGSTLRLGSAAGITSAPTASGNIQFGTRSFNGGANYVYSGSVDQATGSGLPSTITGSLTIANTGSSGSNTVTLTNNNTTVSTLNLSSGLFAAGTGQNINLSNGGTVNDTGGDFATGATAGTITATSTAVFNGTSSPYNVYASGGVNFGGQTVTIQNGGTFRINAGGFVSTNAPFYGSGSTLEYNTGGNYDRGLEWSSSSGRGAPHHVTITSTTLNPAKTGAGYASTAFNTLGDLTIASGGNIYMDFGGNNMSVPLNIAGNLNLTGNLSASQAVGGDINVGGNWTNNGSGLNFFSNNRQVNFNGSSAQTIGGSNATVPAFEFLAITNTSGDVTTNLSLSVNQRLQMNSGKLILGNNNLTLGSAAFFQNGGASSFVVTNGTGTVTQNVNGGDDWYPVGPSTSIFGPITLNQNTGSGGVADNISVRVSTAPAFTNAVNDNSKMVNLEWTISEGTAGGNNLSTTFGWTSSSEASSFDRSAGVFHGNYTGSGYVARASNATSGSGPYYSLSTTSQPYTGNLTSQRFVVGNIAGILTCLQTSVAGNWNNASNWLNGLVPTAGMNVCIRHAMSVSTAVDNPAGVTFESGGSLNISNGTTLTLTSPGTITNSSGSFLNMTSGTIAFSGLGIVNGGNAIGFNNLQLNGNTTLTTTPTINNTLEIKAGGFLLSAIGPDYGASSTLKYNTGGSYNRSNEWNAGSGSGYPASVQVSGNTSLDISTGAAGTRRISGNMTIDAGSSLTQGLSNQGLIVAGNFTLNGSYSMSTIAGGDLVVTGNWSSGASASLTHNSRDIRFDGAGAQTISVANGLVFGFLTVDNSGSGVDLLNPVTVNTFRVNAGRTFNLNTDKIIIAAGGNLLNNGTFNANAGTIEYTNGGNFTNNGTFNRGTSTLDFIGATAGVVTGTVQTNFHNIRLFPGGGIDFGSGLLRGKVSGTLQLRAGSYVANNAPIYEPGSKLMYSGGGTYNRNVEWDASTLQKVEITNNTTLKGGTNGTTFSHVMADSLIIRSGSSLDLSSPDMTATMTVGGHVLNNGTITLSGEVGGDLELRGDLENNGSLNVNNRLINFAGSNSAQLRGSNIPAVSYLNLDKGASGISVTGNLVVSTSFTLNSGKMYTGTDTVILGPAATITENYAAGSYLVGNLKTIRTVNTAASNFGGMGVQLTAGDDLGTVMVIRSSGDQGLITGLPLSPDSSIRWNWIITPSQQPASEAPNRSLTLSWPSLEDNNRNSSSLQIWKRSTESDPWEEAGGIQIAGGNETLRSVVWSDVTGFSQFTVGENNIPLALELLSLQASKEKNYARIEWRVSEDSKALFYQLEKSVDNGRTYSPIEKREAGAKAGLYTANDYRFVSDSYYRIRVIREDGTEDVSRSVFLKAGEGSNSFVLVPNPSSTGKGVRLQSAIQLPVGELLLVKVYNSAGKVSLELSGKAGEINAVLEAESANLPAGVYQLQLQYSSGMETLRFVKE